MEFTGSRRRSVVGGSVGATLGLLVCALASPVGLGLGAAAVGVGTCEVSTFVQAWRLQGQLRVDAASSLVVAQERGVWEPGSCCAYAVAAVAVVSASPPPAGVDVAVRWVDPADVEWITVNGNAGVGTYEMSCLSCGASQVRRAFLASADPGVVVWSRSERLYCPL